MLGCLSSRLKQCSVVVHYMLGVATNADSVSASVAEIINVFDGVFSCQDKMTLQIIVLNKHYS